MLICFISQLKEVYTDERQVVDAEHSAYTYVRGSFGFGVDRHHKTITLLSGDFNVHLCRYKYEEDADTILATVHRAIISDASPKHVDLSDEVQAVVADRVVVVDCRHILVGRELKEW